MQTKTVQCARPEDLQAQVDLIIAADAPTFMQVVQTVKSFYLIIWM